MPFTTEDRDRIRDYLGYPWTYNDHIDDILTSAYNEHGNSVVDYVQERLDLLDEIKDTIEADLVATNSNVKKIEITDWYVVDIEPGSSAISGSYTRKARLINEIRNAIDPYGWLVPATTELYRS